MFRKWRQFRVIGRAPQGAVRLGGARDGVTKSTGTEKGRKKGKRSPESNSGRNAKWEQLETWKTDTVWQ